MWVLEQVFKSILIVVFVLICVAFFTVAERKVMGSIQRRLGPNSVGRFGLLQAFSDGLKLLVKESVFPSSAFKELFVKAPLITFSLSLVVWAVIPVGEGAVFSDMLLGILIIFVISSLGVYGVILAGWASNSKYSFLGALRSTAQIVSYEISFGFILVSVALCCGSLNFSVIIKHQTYIWLCAPLFPLVIIFFISCLAETNRHPFDLPEAEAELVSGYNVEYSAMTFALFFLGEYSNIIIISALTVILFFGGGSPSFSVALGPLVFSFKTLFFILLFIFARAGLPRYRYDQLMRLGWKVFLPFSMGWLLFVSGVLLGFNCLNF